MQKYYIKATLDGGTSGYDPRFKYKVGFNKHPKPDFESKESCGVGIHLAKNVSIARNYVNKASELYLATIAGKILGKDRSKVRVDSCNILGQIPPDILRAYDKAEAQAYRKLIIQTLRGLKDV